MNSKKGPALFVFKTDNAFRSLTWLPHAMCALDESIFLFFEKHMSKFNLNPFYFSNSRKY